MLILTFSFPLWPYILPSVSFAPRDNQGRSASAVTCAKCFTASEQLKSRIRNLINSETIFRVYCLKKGGPVVDLGWFWGYSEWISRHLTTAGFILTSQIATRCSAILTLLPRPLRLRSLCDPNDHKRRGLGSETAPSPYTAYTVIQHTHQCKSAIKCVVFHGIAKKSQILIFALHKSQIKVATQKCKK